MWKDFIEEVKDWTCIIGGPLEDRPTATADDAWLLEHLAARIREKIASAKKPNNRVSGPQPAQETP